MEHFKPFVHVRNTLAVLAGVPRRVLAHRQNKEAGDSQEQTGFACIRKFRLSWKTRHPERVEAAIGKHLVKEGVKLAMRGELNQAIVLFEKAAEQGYQQPALYYNWGLAQSHLGEHENACEMYLTALELDPGCVDAAVNWGVSLAALERHEEATEKYRQASEIDSKASAIFFNWGCSLVAMDRHDDACEMFEKAAQLSPKDAQIHYNWAVCLARTGQVEAAIERLEAFSKLARGRFKDQVEHARSLLEPVEK